MRADEVLQTTFTQTQFRRGYDEREVDVLLDDVVLALRHHEAGGSSDAAPMRAEDVAHVRFTQTQYRRGYDEGEVDDLLDLVRQNLEACEKRQRTTLPPPSAPPPVSSTSPPAEGQPGIGARALRWLRGDPR